MIPASNTAFRYAIGLIVAMLVLCAFVVAYRLYVTIGMCEAIEQARSNSSTSFASMNSVSDIETGSSYKHPRSLISMPKPIASIGTFVIFLA